MPYFKTVLCLNGKEYFLVSICFNASSTSEVVNRLEEDGYVIRTVDESDRRATLLHLTELGKARAAEIRDEKEAVLEELFSPLSPSEKETLAELLDKLNNR